MSRIPPSLLREATRAGPLGSPWLAAWLAALTTLTGLAGLNAYVGYIPTLPALFGQVPTTSGRTGSEVLRVVIGAPPTLDVPRARPSSISRPATTARPTPAAATRSSTCCTAIRAARSTGSGPSPPSGSWTPCSPTT